MTKRYVVGFMVSPLAVVLVRKNRPEWQAGLLNGVGGKVEEQDRPWASGDPIRTIRNAMSREFFEETGCNTRSLDWTPMCTIEWPNDEVRVADAEPSSVTFLRLRVSHIPHSVKTVTDEEIVVVPFEELALGMVQVIPNLDWLIPLARYTADDYQHFTIQATTAEILTGGTT